MVIKLEKLKYIIKMEILNMKVISLKTKKKEMENIYGKMVNIMKAGGLMVKNMEKVQYIIKMEKLNIMVILLMVIMKDMGNIYGKMVNIIKGNG